MPSLLHGTVFKDLWQGLPQYRTLVDGLRKGHGEQAFFGLQPGQVAYLLGSLFLDLKRPVIVVTTGFREALSFAAEISGWIGGEEVHYFPPQEVVPYSVIARSPEVAGQRLKALTSITMGKSAVVVTPVQALLRPLPPRKVFSSLIQEFAIGDTMSLENAVDLLIRGGYERVDSVEGPGHFAVRGGILDVFPLTEEQPLRIEWFGDEIESIRLFNRTTQRSEKGLDYVVIPPARETVRQSEADSETREVILREAEETALRLRSIGKSKDADTLLERVQNHLASMTPAQWELYAPYLYQGATIFDYFPVSPVTILMESKRLEDALNGAELQWRERTVNLLESGRLLPSQRGLLLSSEAIQRVIKRQQTIYMSLLPQMPTGASPRATLSLSGKPVPSFQGQWNLFVEELNSWLRQGYGCLLVCTTDERAARISSGLEEAGIEAPRVEGLPQPGRVAVITGQLASGFIFPAIRLAVVTEDRLFGSRKRATVKEKGHEGQPLASYADLKVGDYVVHVHHGIGRYLGVKTLEVQGTHRDYLYLQYSGEDRLYVPVEQINLIQKYVGGETGQIKLYKLGGNEWSRVKERVKESVRKMAEELLRLYAARQALQGHAFPEDTVWQKQFEDAFPYEETADQLKSIEEIKRDMERPQPMDRLLCGDVGFGKTEVAMRAAFKAVSDGKQVAVLVPTTILAQQHLVTFRERFEGFPVNIDMLSRFRTKKEQEAVITALRRGDIDIVIGTHRLLAGDVNFKDLGLLVVDEEHRFGVAHKETLKRLRSTVDVLTMTATPIPRTLHMAMTGLRDMSVISTPPENRLPIETYVVEYDEELVAEAIRQELSRGGQLFFVHNRVKGIHRVAQRLQELVPDARIAVGHGQMQEEELERIMLDFLEGRQDILVSTSIIESGLDIPNANTLIVDESDRLGLAQLYQIRGRVGRSNRLAYAYFTYRREKILGEVAQKRLEAIKDFTELGSGFKIALRDLEIRGAGNILGPEQHGFIISVGFDLYCQLIDEAVRELKGEKSVPQTEPSIELLADAYLDDSYVPDVRAKIELYKKVNASRTLESVASIRAEMQDRFGKIPEAAENLLRLATIRILAAEMGVLSIVQEKEQVRLVFATYLKELLKSFEPLRAKYDRRLQIQVTPRPILRFRIKGNVLVDVLELLEAVSGIPQIKEWLSNTSAVATELK